jgi:predicted lactoylglutathione lyase
MQPRVSVLTLGVKDLEKSVAFYRDGLGWPTEGIVGQEIENGAVAFFDLQNGLKLAVWPQESLAKDAGLTDTTPNNSTAFSLGHNVNSKEEVDEAFEKAVQAGAISVVKPQDKAWGGYAGYFRDLDGHLWEVVWNPALEV